MTRQENIGFMATLLAERLEILPLIEDAAGDTQDRDKTGQNISSLKNDYRFLAIAYYLLNGDVSAFREYMSRVS